MTTAASAVLGSPDLLRLVVAHLPASELRRAAAVARLWHAAVHVERTRRLKLPRTQWVLLGGSPPDLGQYTTCSAAFCKRVDVVGAPDASVLPPLPYTLAEASAVVMANGAICVGGEPAWPFEHPFHVLRFCPRRWCWETLVPLPVERARRCITLASPDGVRLFALGGFVGQKECQVKGDNACNLVDELVPQTSEWVARAPLPHAMINPVVLPAAGPGAPNGNGTLAFWCADDDEIQYDGVVPLVPGGDVCVSGLPSPSFSTPVAVQQLQSDLLVAAYVDDSHIVLRGCRPRAAWVDLGTIRVEDLGVEISAPPTVAYCRLPTFAPGGEEMVVVSHSFWTDDDHSIRSYVGWWGAPLQAVRRAVHEDAAAQLEWRSVRNAVGTPVREHAACVRIPVYDVID